MTSTDSEPWGHKLQSTGWHQTLASPNTKSVKVHMDPLYIPVQGRLRQEDCHKVGGGTGEKEPLRWLGGKKGLAARPQNLCLTPNTNMAE